MQSSSFVITLNGSERAVESQTVFGLLEELSLAGKKIAVERNKQIVPRTAYQETALQAGDTIEIIQFVGGG